jgi:hypothetical protein
MSASNLRPKWWQLYLTFPLLIVLFAAENRLKISSRGHQAVQIVIVLLIFGLIHLWIKANSSALSRMDQEQYSGRVTVIRIPPDQLSDLKIEERSMFATPASEIKGVLSDPFEMDYIDAEFFKREEYDGRDVNVKTINDKQT